MSSHHHDDGPFVLRCCCRHVSLHMFCSLYCIVLQCFPPSFLYMHAPIVKCSHNNSHFFRMPSSLINYIDTIATNASITPYLGACIAQFKGFTLLVETTCRRSYICLASLDAQITSGRSFFSPFSKFPSARFCLNVVCLHGDVYFLPSSLLPSLVWSEFSTSYISQSDPNSPFLIK
jgi:hypothetical protein